MVLYSLQYVDLNQQGNNPVVFFLVVFKYPIMLSKLLTMYYVYKMYYGQRVLKGTFDNLELAKFKAKKIKGLVYRDNQIWFDCRL